jgi:hypothetical protein
LCWGSDSYLSIVLHRGSDSNVSRVVLCRGSDYNVSRVVLVCQVLILTCLCVVVLSQNRETCRGGGS